jgi:hypothetical protein
MKTLFTSLFFFILLLPFDSCSPVVYSTTGHVVPLFREKGEATLSGGYATSNDGEGFHVQAAGAVSDKWALITSVYAMSEKSSDRWAGHGTYFEVGTGRFGSFGTNNTFIYETFAGIGFAGIKNTYQNSSLDVNFMKPFIQPSVGISQKWLDVALTPRFGVVSYTHHDIQTSDAAYRTAAENYFADQKTTFVFEPGLTLRVGAKNLKLQLQYNISTFSYHAEDANSNSNPSINNQYVGIGLHYLLSTRYR